MSTKENSGVAQSDHARNKKERPGGTGMLQKLGGHIADALARADAAERQSAEASDPSIGDDYEKIAKGWRHLAESYQFVESLERFLLDARVGRDARPLDAAE